jgi:hypothetical protein
MREPLFEKLTSPPISENMSVCYISLSHAAFTNKHHKTLADPLFAALEVCSHYPIRATGLLSLA